MTNLNYIKYGDYYIPDIKLKEETSVNGEIVDTPCQQFVGTYGKYGILREKFLKHHRNSQYTAMLLCETLNEYLCEFDAEAKRQDEQIISQMVCSKGVSEEMKLKNQIGWAQRMNAIRKQAEEMVLQDLIYS